MRYLLFLLLLLPLVAAHDTGVPHEEADVCGPGEPGSQADWQPYFVLGVGLTLIGLAQHVGFGRMGTALGILVGVLFIIGGMWLLWIDLEINSDTVHFGAPGSTHEHADFQLMLNNQIVDLTDERYLSIKDRMLSNYVHLHFIDNVVHVHATGVTWKYFFRTLNVPLDDECLRLRDQTICNATFIINGERVTTLDVPIKDGDQALFHYGGGNATIFYWEAVGDESCLYSHTCPERGFYTDCAVTD